MATPSICLLFTVIKKHGSIPYILSPLHTNKCGKRFLPCKNLLKIPHLHGEKHLSHEICQRKLSRVKGAFFITPQNS